PIIVQAAVPVKSSDTEESLQARIQRAEHLCYPQALKLIAEGRVQVAGEKARVKDDGFAEDNRLINPT
ncbi:MAG TPA: phosphoribosylglycinamide formyltransferase, partial [Alphaproteobacteria bacterium]|nr:phosphoribosylglycinamide formyltransferase [Alphaproteobacteria bacterium]